MRISSPFSFAGRTEWLRYCLLLTAVLTSLSFSINGQTPGVQKPRVVQPGAPGQPTRQLPSETRGSLPATSPKDVEFMQGMIMHHAQAVEMTALIAGRTTNRDILLLGERISKSQEDEIAFMIRWLELRNQPTETKAHGSSSHGGGSHRMPGMLSAAQMNELRNAKGSEFDRLFLEGMIQHHEGALVMVKDLFETAGAGQDAELFNFATDVDSGQRAEIKTMETLLSKIP
ncbi:MAG TPA: DUF305 domain-containing protein [Blastocatellia bacterium]|nr:DUF305 domain-containing protein [Blastocatellia bacterium]